MACPPGHIQIRRDTDTNWNNSGSRLLPGEFAYSTTSGVLKIGDTTNPTWGNAQVIGSQGPAGVLNPIATSTLTVLALTPTPGSTSVVVGSSVGLVVNQPIVSTTTNYGYSVINPVYITSIVSPNTITLGVTSNPDTGYDSSKDIFSFGGTVTKANTTCTHTANGVSYNTCQISAGQPVGVSGTVIDSGVGGALYPGNIYYVISPSFTATPNGSNYDTVTTFSVSTSASGTTAW